MGWLCHILKMAEVKLIELSALLQFELELLGALSTY